MRASVGVAWRVAAAVAFAATAALAVTLTRGAPLHASLASSRNDASLGAAGHRHAPGGPPQCALARLDVSIEGSGTAAARIVAAHGIVQFPVDFTNTSATACTLSGFPEVSAYRGGAQVGNAAALDTSINPQRIVLVPGATAHAAVEDSAASGRCRVVAVTGLRVVPPGQSVARYVPHAMTACSATGRTAPVFLHVRAVQPGFGEPAGIQADRKDAHRPGRPAPACPRPGHHRAA